MRGCRVPDGEFFEDPQPGDYGKIVIDGAVHWFNWPPGADCPGVLKRLDRDAEAGTPAALFHEVVEHDDGTITVKGSILMRDGIAHIGKGAPLTHGDWHGYLERGVWREV